MSVASTPEQVYDLSGPQTGREPSHIGQEYGTPPPPTGAAKRFPIVGIGASAGGVEALQLLFRAMPPDIGMAFVIVTHLGPNRESALPDILAHCTAMPVAAVHDGEEVRPNRIHVLATDAGLGIQAGRLTLHPHDPNAGRANHPIDSFLAALADDQHDCAIGILLSGGGSDGTLGLKAIKARGGLTIAQGTDGTAPRYPSMPDSAIALRVVDLILPVEDIPARLAAFAQGFYPTPPDTDPEPAVLTVHDTISAILLEQLGHDFAGYKPSTFLRRVGRRMHVLELATTDAYVDRLRVDHDEVVRLFDDLLIGVTDFFRDADAFQALTTQVIPRLFDAPGSHPVRVWVPGCATGEEVYSLAMLLREHMDSMNDPPSVQIFATDIDEAALTVARAGRYPAALVGNVAPERLARFFHTQGSVHAIRPELRDLCTFSTHSVIRDAPFSRIDLISCRNMLIYMGIELQEQLIPTFHFALRPGGFLFLGLSETISRNADLFDPVDRASHIFRRRAQPTRAVHRMLSATGTRQPSPALHTARPFRRESPDTRAAAELLILDEFAPPHVVINRDGDIIHQSSRLGAYLEPASGTPNRQLLAMARRGLRSELRGALREAMETRRRTVRPRLTLTLGGRVEHLALTIAPLPARDTADPLFIVVFAAADSTVETSTKPTPADPADATERQVAQLERELHDSREHEQSMVEEYETAAEELKSANEEMTSVNEELQSTNEELETSKEEQQSINEELRTVNAELGSKVEELDQANADLRNLFDSTRIATLFLDRNLIIRNFTPAVTRIFNLVPADRGRPLTAFASLVEGLELRADVQRVLDRREEIERKVSSPANDLHYMMRLLPYWTAAGEVDGVIVTFVDVTSVIEREELSTLVGELNHRVRNMLQVVLAVAAITLRRATSLDTFRKSFNGRLQALARAHALVSAGGWADVSLLDLVLKEIEPYAGAAARLTTGGPPVHLKPKAALALGLALHEFATNAAKHGALSAEAGHIDVTWTVEGEQDGGRANARLLLRWRERGGPPVQSPSRRGFGSELIERQVRDDLHGTLVIDYAVGGLTADLSVPLADAAGPGHDWADRPVTASVPATLH